MRKTPTMEEYEAKMAKQQKEMLEDGIVAVVSTFVIMAVAVALTAVGLWTGALH